MCYMLYCEGQRQRTGDFAVVRRERNETEDTLSAAVSKYLTHVRQKKILLREKANVFCYSCSVLPPRLLNNNGKAQEILLIPLCCAT
jgi:hypothetical protein